MDEAPKFDPPPRFDPPAMVAAADPPPKFPTRFDYAACLAAVEGGQTVYLSVGVNPQWGDYSADHVKGRKPGRYSCYKTAAGHAEMQLVDKDGNAVPLAESGGADTETPAVAPEVRPTLTFRPAQSVPQLQSGLPAVRVTSAGATPVVTGERSHLCPSCGAGPWTTVMSFNANGTHNHRCLNCGTAFTH